MKYKLYRCSCGAYGIDDGTKEIKWAGTLENLNYYTNLHLTEKDFENVTSSWGCDYCCNHWGLDLCECGSGELIEECECGAHTPSQVFGTHERRPLWVF